MNTGDTIDCFVSGSRRHSSDLPQGGLEVPCKLVFKGLAKFIVKVRKLLQPDLGSTIPPPCKKTKFDDKTESTVTQNDPTDVVDAVEWVRLNPSYVLTGKETE